MADAHLMTQFQLKPFKSSFINKIFKVGCVIRHYKKCMF